MAAVNKQTNKQKYQLRTNEQTKWVRGRQFIFKGNFLEVRFKGGALPRNLL